MTKFEECVVKAEQTSDLLRNDLLQALSVAKPVQSLIVLQLITRAANLNSELCQLVEALK